MSDLDVEVADPDMVDAIEVAAPETTDPIEVAGPEIIDAVEVVDLESADAIDGADPEVMDTIDTVEPEIADAIEVVDLEVTDALEVVGLEVADATDTAEQEIADTMEVDDTGGDAAEDTSPELVDVVADDGGTIDDGFVWPDLLPFDATDDGTEIADADDAEVSDACKAEVSDAYDVEVSDASGDVEVGDEPGVCGDGTVDEPLEACDDGNEIDDGNDDDTDACLSTCTAAVCGDGHVFAGEEECDDGNDLETDDCLPSCVEAICGDGILHVGVEACDDGIPGNGDGCNDDCVISGTVMWSLFLDGEGLDTDLGSAVAIDDMDDIVVVGSAKRDDLGQGYDVWFSKLDADGAVLWTQTFDGDESGDDIGEGVAVGASGEIYVVGSVEHATLGQGHDIWVGAYDELGTEVWTTSVDGAASDTDFATGVAVDSSGDVIVVGTVYGGVDTTGNDVWVCKLTAAGDTVWTTTYDHGLVANDIGYAVAVDGDDNVLVTDTVAYGDPLSFDIWTAKLDPDGAIMWAETFASSNDGKDIGYGVATDASGGVYVTGCAHTELPGSLNCNLWVRKYNPAGTTLWTDVYDSIFMTNGGNDTGYGVATDFESNVVVVGIETRMTTMTDAIVRKYTTSGDLMWGRTYPGADVDTAGGVAIDSLGYIVLMGDSYLPASGNADFMLVRFAP